MPEPRFLLAIPVYNEQQHVRDVLRQARAHIDQILVVDDGSTDRTPNLLIGQSELHLIRHQWNQGYGKSLADAFGFAVSHGFDWLITMDCDDQHEPAEIPKFIAAALADEADLISGSRYLADLPGNNNPPADRRRINARITAMLNDRLALGITDAFCGFKAYRVATLAGLKITEPGYAMPLQLWVQAARARWCITELPVRLVYRDPTRSFGGALDDPSNRHRHYVAVFESELARTSEAEQPCPRGEVVPAGP